MKDCLECTDIRCHQAGKDVVPLRNCFAGKDEIYACPNCDGCRKLDFYYCANCGRQLRKVPIGG